MSAVSARVQVLVLTQRLLSELLAEPAPLIGTMILAPSYLIIQNALFGSVADHAPGVHGDYLGFIVPSAVLVATIASTNAGFAVLRDEHDRYLDRLLTLPVPRVAIVAAPLLFGVGYALCNASVVLILAAALGLVPVTGPLGALAMLAIAALWGLAIAGFLVAVALVTKSMEMVQLADLACFPFLFLSSLTLPRQDYGRLLRVVTTANPTTYAVDGLRTIMRSGWVLSDVWPAFAVAVACAAITVTAASIAASWATAYR
jgi:ABC-2 type transport system permease protein